jgi:hypothetical protein
MGGDENLWSQGYLLTELASAGYIIVGHKSGGEDGPGRYMVD